MVEEQQSKGNNLVPTLIVGIILVAAVAIFALNPFKAENSSGTPLAVLPIEGEAQEEPQSVSETIEIAPGQFAVRQRYFEETFRPKRDEYNLFEKASQFLGIPIEKVPAFFSLNSESEIFSQLPKIPEDFSEIAYLLASGRYYAIGSLSEEYFQQPEFYPGFKDQGLKYWSEPNPKYWATNGYGTYPAEQFDTLSVSGRKDFIGVVFFYTGYGVQTYQGATIIPSSESLEHFDIEVSPSTFLLEPVFPKFSRNWANQVTIKGKLRDGTPPGEYEIDFMVVAPPREKREEWEFKYRNLYFDAANAISPSGYPIKFTINVTE
ncbi:MAG: hypothetical protein NUV67_04775 [archaeon]|nr:hypothetical protein [archaeon]